LLPIRQKKEEWQQTKCFVFDYELYCPLAMALLIHNDCAIARRAACFEVTPGVTGRRKKHERRAF